MNENRNPLSVQVGGDHYKNFKVQPVEFIEANRLGFLPGCMIKRICRFDQPTGRGVQDLEKVVHEIDLFAEIHGLEVLGNPVGSSCEPFQIDRYAGDAIRADDPAIALEDFLVENGFGNTVRGSILTYIYYAVRAFQFDEQGNGENASALFSAARSVVSDLVYIAETGFSGEAER